MYACSTLAVTTQQFYTVKAKEKLGMSKKRYKNSRLSCKPCQVPIKKLWQKKLWHWFYTGDGISWEYLDEVQVPTNTL